jgi:hypothetical protein
MVSWINNMTVTTAELIVFSMIAIFVSLVIIYIIEIFNTIKVRHDHQFIRSIKYSTQLQYHRLIRINKRYNILYEKNKSSLRTYDNKLYITGILNYCGKGIAI